MELSKQPLRAPDICLDVRGSKDQVRENLIAFHEKLQDVLTGEKKMEGIATIGLQRSPLQLQTLKMQEIISPENIEFQIASFVDDFSPREIKLLLQNLLPSLQRVGIDIHFSEGDEGGGIVIDGEEIMFDADGRITESPNPALNGANAFQFVACFIKQDLAGVIKRGERFEYIFDISAFEKTPKDDEGRNRFLGKDIREFHGKAPNFGATLGPIFENILRAFSEKKLHSIAVDLHGGNEFTKDSVTVRRFERDTFIPLIDESGEFMGFLGAADACFQDIDEPRSPFEGGSVQEDILSQLDLFRFGFRKKIAEASDVMSPHGEDVQGGNSGWTNRSYRKKKKSSACPR